MHVISVMSIVVPTAFFSALDNGAVSQTNSADDGLPPNFVPLVNDFVRRCILRISRGFSVVLIVMSRIFRVLPP